MRRIISIIFLSLMLLQAIPVLHFFSTQPEVFYAYIDEEKPDETSKEKKEAKESLSITVDIILPISTKKVFGLAIESTYRSPILVFLTPPPDAS